MTRAGWPIAAAAGLLVLDAALRLVAREPYPGSTALLVAACGISLLPFLPRELATPSLRLAIAPALGVGSFALLLTTVSILSVELTEVSIRTAVLALVLAAAVGAQLARHPPAAAWSRRRELVAVAGLVGVFALSLASSLDVVEPYPPPGTDWAHNLMYADEVAARGDLLVRDPYSAETDEPPLLANPPGIGALYGSALVVDGVRSQSLARGIAIVSAVASLAVYAAVAGLWGTTAGLLAAFAYAVAPIRLEPMYWHGLGTTLALVFFPLVLLAAGRLYRGQRDARTIALLGFAFASIAAVHPASGIVLAAMVGAIILVDVLTGVVRARRRPATGLRSWWRSGLTRPVLVAGAVAGALGAGVIVHLRRQTDDLGTLVSYRSFDRDWLDLDIVEYYYSWLFLALVGAAALLIVGGRERRRDPALAALGALAVAAVVVSQLWRVELPFEYRRVVYYVGPALVALVGVASYRLAHRKVWIAACAVAFVLIAQDSFGLRLPERLVRGEEPRSAMVDALDAFRTQLERSAEPADGTVLVADRCLGVLVPYVVQRPTLVSAEPWQAGYERLVPDARAATTIVEGGPEGQRLARERGVDYVLLDKDCGGPALAGEIEYENEELIVVDPRPQAARS